MNYTSLSTILLLNLLHLHDDFQQLSMVALVSGDPVAAAALVVVAVLDWVLIVRKNN